MRRFLKRRRTYKLLLLISAAALIYLAFQIFSVEMLTKENLHASKSVVKSHIAGGKGKPIHVVKKADVHENPDLPAKEKYIENKEERKYLGEKKEGVKVQNKVDNVPHFHKSPSEQLNNKKGTLNEAIPKFTKLRPPDVPRGVDPEKVESYRRNPAGKFTCLQSEVIQPSFSFFTGGGVMLTLALFTFLVKENLTQTGTELDDFQVWYGLVNLESFRHSSGDGLNEVIPFSRVNDDYCDCDDGSDEPGTSACPNSRFFCDYQIVNRPRSVFSSRVNDGICDCCDGSDEWANNTVMDWFKVKDGEKSDLLHAPCKNTCHAQEENLLAEFKLKQAGQELKQKYINIAQEKKNSGTDLSEYGPDGIFYKLSQECHTLKNTDYEYTVCPWKDVRQQAFPRPSKCLGRNASWLANKNGVYKLQMVGGDRDLCPDHMDRKTIITFTCGLEDKVTSVYENERCVYSVDFLTPAAC